MITLLTKDGSKTGNAIIYGGTTPEESGRDTPDGRPIFYVETDFGNHMRLTWREIEELFSIGRACDYHAWRDDRQQLHNPPDLFDQGKDTLSRRAFMDHMRP